MFEQDYYFGNILRQNFVWANPNHAAAALTAAIPATWIFQSLEKRSLRQTVPRLGSIIAEGILIALVMVTFSRGAIVALLCGNVYFALATRRSGPTLATDINPWAISLVRWSILLLFFFVTGFQHRITQSAIDPSVTNRLEIWAKAAACFFWCPSGFDLPYGVIYAQWLDPVPQGQRFLTAVNGFMHLALTQGFFVLLAVLSAIAFLIGCGFARPNRKDPEPPVFAAAGASILIFAVCNVFSTLWPYRDLWSAPALAIGAIAGFCRLSQPAFCRCALFSLLAGIMMTTALFAIGRWTGRNLPWRVSQPAAGVLLVERNKPDTPPPALVVLPELSRNYGPALRDAFTETRIDSALIWTGNSAQRGPASLPVSIRAAVSFGDRFDELAAPALREMACVVALPSSFSRRYLRPAGKPILILPAPRSLFADDSWATLAKDWRAELVTAEAEAMDIHETVIKLASKRFLSATNSNGDATVIRREAICWNAQTSFSWQRGRIAHVANYPNAATKGPTPPSAVPGNPAVVIDSTKTLGNETDKQRDLSGYVSQCCPPAPPGRNPAEYLNLGILSP